MADETTKVIILSVELDTNQFSKALNQTEKDLEGLLTQQAVLIAQNKQGTQEYALLSAQIQKTRKDYRDNAQALNTVQQLQKKNTGSIFEMRRELSAATLQYNNLSKAERDNATVGGRLQTQIKALSTELKKNEGAIGDNRRNVGNYQQAIQGALAQTNLFGGSLSQLSGLLSSGGLFGAALLGAVGAAKLLSDAFLSVDSNADLVERKIAGLSAGLKTFTGSFAKGTSEKLIDLFNPTGFVLLLNALTGRLDQAKEAIKVTETLTGAQQSLNDAERDASTVISANNVLIDQYIARSKNRTLSDKERLSILAQASRLEEQNLAKETQIAEARLRIIRIENQLNARNQDGQLTDEQKQREADAINAINKLRQDSLALQERIQTRQDTILDNAEKRNKERNDKIIAEEKRKQAELQKIGKMIFVDDYKLLLEQREETTNLFADQEELELKQRFADRLITEEEFAKGLVNVEVARLQAELDLLVENSATELNLENEIAAKKIEIETALADGKIKQNERVTQANKKELDKQIKLAQTQQDIIQGFIGDIGQAYSDSLNEQGKITEEFEKNIARVILDTLEKTLIASVTAQSFAQPDSVATLGASGLIRAGIMVGLIKAAFAVVRGQIGDSGTKFEKGGMPGERGFIIGGNPHSQGGTKFIGSDGSRFEAEKNEAMIILNKRATDKMRYYSSLNYNSGGVDFFKGNKSSTYLQDGGFAARAVTQPVLDEANAQQAFNNLPPIFVLVEDINSAQGLQAKVKSRSVF